MKKLIALVLTLACVLALTGCGKNDTYKIKIVIPAGSTEEIVYQEDFVYSDEEISPIGNKITIYSGDGLGDTEVVLKPSNLLANGAAPKDVQELLGHSDVSTTMNVYAHSTRDAKRKSVRLLDKVVGND